MTMPEYPNLGALPPEADIVAALKIQHPPFHPPPGRALPSLRAASSCTSVGKAAVASSGSRDHLVTRVPRGPATYGLRGRDVTADHVPSALEHALAGLVPWFQAEDEERA